MSNPLDGYKASRGVTSHVIPTSGANINISSGGSGGSIGQSVNSDMGKFSIDFTDIPGSIGKDIGSAIDFGGAIFGGVASAVGSIGIGGAHVSDAWNIATSGLKGGFDAVGNIGIPGWTYGNDKVAGETFGSGKQATVGSLLGAAGDALAYPGRILEYNYTQRRIDDAQKNVKDDWLTWFLTGQSHSDLPEWALNMLDQGASTTDVANEMVARNVGWSSNAGTQLVASLVYDPFWLVSFGLGKAGSAIKVAGEAVSLGRATEGQKMLTGMVNTVTHAASSVQQRTIMKFLGPTTSGIFHTLGTKPFNRIIAGAKAVSPKYSDAFRMGLEKGAANVAISAIARRLGQDAMLEVTKAAQAGEGALKATLTKIGEGDVSARAIKAMRELKTIAPDRVSRDTQELLQKVAPLAADMTPAMRQQHAIEMFARITGATEEEAAAILGKVDLQTYQTVHLAHYGHFGGELNIAKERALAMAAEAESSAAMSAAKAAEDAKAGLADAASAMPAEVKVAHEAQLARLSDVRAQIRKIKDEWAAANPKIRKRQPDGKYLTGSAVFDAKVAAGEMPEYSALIKEEQTLYDATMATERAYPGAASTDPLFDTAIPAGDPSVVGLGGEANAAAGALAPGEKMSGTAPMTVESMRRLTMISERTLTEQDARLILGEETRVAAAARMPEAEKELAAVEAEMAKTRANWLKNNKKGGFTNPDGTPRLNAAGNPMTPEEELHRLESQGLLPKLKRLAGKRRDLQSELKSLGNTPQAGMSVHDAVQRYEILAERFLGKDYTEREILDFVKAELQGKHLPRRVEHAVTNNNPLLEPLAEWRRKAIGNGYDLGFAPENQWRMITDETGVPRWMRPFVPFVSDAESLTQRNAIGKATDALFRGVTQSTIIIDSRNRFIKYGMQKNLGLSQHELEGVHQNILHMARDRNVAPRGLIGESFGSMSSLGQLNGIDKAFIDVIGPDGLAALRKKTDPRYLVMKAFEGSLKNVGYAQKFTGAVKSQIPWVANITDNLFPKVRFKWNPTFQAQESIESSWWNAMRGVRKGVVPDDIAATMRDFSETLPEFKYMTEAGFFLNIAGEESLTRATAGSLTQRLTSRIPRPNIAEAKAQARLAQALAQHPEEFQKAVLTINPELWKAMEESYRTSDAAVITEAFLRERFALTGGNINEAMKVVDAAKPALASADEETVWLAFRESFRRSSMNAFKTHYFNPERGWFERSINHIFLGLYPASYMWGKVLPEYARFMLKSPFGLNMPLAGAEGLRRVQEAAAGAMSDPEFSKWVGKHKEAIYLVEMMIPGTPQNLPANAPAWARHTAVQAARHRPIDENFVKTQEQDAITHQIGIASSAGNLATAIGQSYSILSEALDKAATEYQTWTAPKQ